MRQSNASGVRNDLLQVIADRTNNIRPRVNETLECDMHNVTLTPHANTQHISYEVPVGREAEVIILPSTVHRRTVASVLGWVSLSCALNVSGGGNQSVHQPELYTNNVGDIVSKPNVGGIIMHAGDKLQFSSVDLSTDGTIRYEMGYYIREYDA